MDKYVTWEKAWSACQELNENATLIRMNTEDEIWQIGKKMTNRNIYIIWLDLISKSKEVRLH